MRIRQLFRRIYIEDKLLQKFLLDWTRGACRPLEGNFLIEKPEIYEGQLDLNTALGPTRAIGFQMNKNRKSDEKMWSPLSAHTATDA